MAYGLRDLPTAMVAAAFGLMVATGSVACTLPQGGGISIAFGDPADRAESGAERRIDWQVAALPEGCDGRATLILDLPPEMRLDGEGFVALLPGDEGPFQTRHAADRLRLVVPLAGEGPWQGGIAVTPYLIGKVTLGSALLHATTTGTGLEEVALDQSLALGPEVALDIAPGRPRLVAQEAAPAGQPDLVQLSPDGAHLLQVFGEAFRVTHAETGALVLAESGFAPRFSPTGRFLHWFPRGYATEALDDQPSFLVGEDFALFDLVSEETVLRLADLPRDYGLDILLGVDWSPGDAFLLLHRGGNCAMSIVQPLVGARSVFDATGSGSCFGQSMGIAVTAPAMDQFGLGNYWGYSLLPTTRSVPAVETESFDNINLDVPTETGIFRLAGAMRSTLAMVEREVVPLLPGPLPPDAAGQALLAVGATTARGAAALDPAPADTRAADALTRALVDRLAVLDITLQAAPDPADWHLTEAETLSLSFHGGPDFGSYDGDGYLLSASQSGLAVPDAAARRLDDLSAWLIPETGACAYMFGLASSARIWTQVMGDLVVQVVQVTCEVGTGSIPEGVVAVLVADLQGNGWATVLAEDVIEPYEGLPDGAPEPARRLGLDADPYVPWQLWPLGDDMVALTAPPDAVVLLDPKRGRVGLISDPEARLDAVSLMALSPDFATLVQANRDGRVILRDMATGDRLAEGAYLDDELVLAYADGTFRWTAEGARHARVKFAGDPAAYALDQLAPPGPDGGFALPPRLSLAEPVAEGRPAAVTLAASGEAGLAALEVYRDGLLVESHDLQGKTADLRVDLTLLPETRAASLILRDVLGARSDPLLLTMLPAPMPPEGRLFALAVGTDSYADRAFAPLTQAGRDARRFAEAIAVAPPTLYASVSTEVSVDDPALATALPARIEAIAALASPADTLFLQLSGHGVLDAEGDFHLATAATLAADLDGTALPWLRLQAALSAFPGRVVVFLDACHSGAVDDPASTFATNDDALAGLSGNEGIAVLSASKGRQLSLENAAVGGGFFTASVVEALAEPSTDADADGAVTLDELYAAIKARTLALSGGRQTPWLSRNGLRGAVTLW